MKIDIFTKVVLVIIAINLTILTLTNLDLIPKVYAKEASSDNKLSNKGYALVPVNDDGSINVRINNETVDVNIENVGGSYVHYALPVEVENIVKVCEVCN